MPLGELFVKYFLKSVKIISSLTKMKSIQVYMVRKYTCNVITWLYASINSVVFYLLVGETTSVSQFSWSKRTVCEIFYCIKLLRIATKIFFVFQHVVNMWLSVKACIYCTLCVYFDCVLKFMLVFRRYCFESPVYRFFVRNNIVWKRFWFIGLSHWAMFIGWFFGLSSNHLTEDLFTG